MDSRWLSKSLEAQYHDLLEDPASYLEKIFQIPFVLQPMPRRDHKRLMDELTQARPSSTATTATSTASTRSTQRIPGGEVAQPTGDKTSDTGSSTQADGASHRPAADVETEVQTGSEEELAAPPPPPPASLVLSDQERDYLGKLAHALPTPRAAKRFVNIYRMLRVSVHSEEEGAYATSTGGEFQVAATLLAVLIGLPDEAPALCRTAEAADADSDLWEVLTASAPRTKIALEPLKQEILAHPLEVWQRWLPRVSRFSFRMQLATDDAET